MAPIRLLIILPRADMVRRHCLDPGTLLAELEAVYTTAIGGQHYNAAMRALDMQARITGAIPGRPAQAAAAPGGASPDPKHDDERRQMMTNDDEKKWTAQEPAAETSAARRPPCRGPGWNLDSGAWASSPCPP